MTTTEACVIHGQRDLRVEMVDLPAPGAGEVLLDIGAGGICGSDLHYYLDGGFGTVRVREPMVLGHEVAGTVAALGPGVTGLRPGERVATDGVVDSGLSAIDAALLTGESVPVEVGAGDAVTGGTLNTNGRLVVREGKNATYEVELRQPVTVIGRAADAGVRLADQAVSRHHAEIRVSAAVMGSQRMSAVKRRAW